MITLMAYAIFGGSLPLFTQIGISVGLMLGAMPGVPAALLTGAYKGFWAGEAVLEASLLLGTVVYFAGWLTTQAGYYG